MAESIKPLTGEELYTEFYKHMQGWSEEASREEWETTAGKNKKAAWNNLAKFINERISSSSHPS